jgi:hypothetical protein
MSDEKAGWASVPPNPESRAVRYSRVVQHYDTPAQFKGCTIAAVYSEYSFATLRLEGGEVISFAVTEESVGKWFEVFPITLHQPVAGYPLKWEELARPMHVVRSAKLWREEWLESSLDPSSHLGAGPHSTQFAAALGTAPASNGQVVKVLAGFELTGQDGSSLVVASSDNTPFKIDLVTDAGEVSQILRFHTLE